MPYNSCILYFVLSKIFDIFAYIMLMLKGGPWSFSFGPLSMSRCGFSIAEESEGNH